MVEGGSMLNDWFSVVVVEFQMSTSLVIGIGQE